MTAGRCRILAIMGYPKGSTLDADQQLEAFVSELYGDFRDPARPAAVVTIKFFLSDAAAGAFVWTAELRGRRDVGTRSAEALVGGLSSALDDVLQQLATALRALPVADLLFNERGEWRDHLNVFIDGADAREQGGPACPLAGAREVLIIAMLSGG